MDAVRDWRTGSMVQSKSTISLFFAVAWNPGGPPTQYPARPMTPNGYDVKKPTPLVVVCYHVS
jgi:hypothetical protein